MKTRNGFVSNSSSSSFCIPRNNFTDEQLEKVKNHTKYGLHLLAPCREGERLATEEDCKGCYGDVPDHCYTKEFPYCWNDNMYSWEVVEDGDNVTISTYWGGYGFPMRTFLKEIGVSVEGGKKRATHHLIIQAPDGTPEPLYDFETELK